MASHLGRPLYSLAPGKYEVHDENPQINPEPLDRYKKAIDVIVKELSGS